MPLTTSAPRRSRTVRTATAVATAVTVAGLVLSTGAVATAHGRSDRATLTEYARDTWASFDAMVDPATGLPADNIAGDLDTSTRSGYTSPTNIGAYLWSTVVARDLGIITRGDARQRLATTLDSVAALERHEASGMFCNWYDEATGELLTTWPADGSTVHPFASTVDNAWLATAMVLVANAEPRRRRSAEAITATMDFGFYYDPAARLLRGGFWVEEPPGGGVLDSYREGIADVWYTGHHDGTLNTEPRMASYLAIAWGQVPAEHLGVQVFEGAYRYRDMQIVPSWGGSMFEALMVDLFVPEAEWGPESWGRNHPLYVRAQIEHGMGEAGYGYWGFSPASDPAGGYREYGVDALGMDPAGYTSDQERTSVDPGWDDPACPREPSVPAGYGDGVVTPHASFLALPYAHDAAMDNLAALRSDPGAYGPGGFYDAVAVGSGTVAETYLALDQGMVMAALGNELRQDSVQRCTVRGAIRQVIEPLLAIEEFSVSR